VNYGTLLSRAWSTIWEHKFLILLGVLVALGSGGGGGGGSAGGNVTFNQPSGEAPWIPQLPWIPELPQMPDMRAVAPAVAIGVIILAIGAIVVGLALWVVSTIARGGLIAGVSAVDEGRPSSFSQAWNAGWRKGGRLLGIGILPAIPAFLLTLIALVFGLGVAGVSTYAGEDMVGVPLAGLSVIAAGLACILVPVMLVLMLLRTFANRACMLEDLGVFASYRRGLQVLLDNFGPALILFLIQIPIGIGITVVGLLPGLLAMLCCLLWPLLIVLLILVRGTISAYFSTMWTLAWREWTGLSGDVADPFLAETVA
jgi:hypothetical protein